MTTPESTPQPEKKSPTDKIIEAIRNNDLNTLDQLLVDLNDKLTPGYRMADFADGAEENRRQQLESFLKDATERQFGSINVYLSDGGASRISIQVDEDDISVKPHPSSLEGVKETWKTLQ